MAITLRLTESQNQRLEEMAEQLGCSKHQAVTKAIEAFDAKADRKHRLRQALDFVLTHDKELLERLADA